MEVSREQKFRDRCCYESWPQLQGAKPLRRKSRKPDQVDIARYSKEQIDAAIDAAVQA